MEKLCSRLQLAADRGIAELVTVLGFGLGIRVPGLRPLLVSQQPAPVAELPPITDESSVPALIAAARAIAEEHTALLQQLRDALAALDRDRALRLAAQLCGLEECHETSNRVAARVH
jgi:hypothetical protein